MDLECVDDTILFINMATDLEAGLNVFEEVTSKAWSIN